MAFTKGTSMPPRIPTDRVIPLHFWDDSPLYRRIALYNLKVFDDVLDPQKLRSSLETLVSQETWRKLGGRLRKDANGSCLEYHIPAEFSESRPAVAFTHVDHSNLDRVDHPLASRLPRPSPVPAVVGDPEESLDLACGPGCPTSLDDYLFSDRPLLGLHVVSFRDATLVTLHWLHVACDALGMKSLVGGWVLALQGRPVPAQQGFDADPLAELGKHPTEPHKLAGQTMSTPSLLAYGLRNGYGLLFGKKECRMVCIPGAFLDGLRTRALRELAAAGVENPFLTENDVLVAWWTRVALAHVSPASSPSAPPTASDLRPVTVQIAMSLRRSLEKDLLVPDAPFVSNCFGFTNLLLPAGELTRRPVSEVAARVRAEINVQSTRPQVEAYQAMVRASFAPVPVFFGSGSTYQVSYSNWTKAGLYQADFSAAAATPRDTPLYPSYIAHCQVPFQFPEGFIVVGKDVAGNTWLCGYRTQGLWAKAEMELEALKSV